MQTIFEEYRQVKGRSDSSVQRGTGLGLSITKKFAELLGRDDWRGERGGKGQHMKGFLGIELRDKTNHQLAQEIAQYLNEHIEFVSYTDLSDA